MEHLWSLCGHRMRTDLSSVGRAEDCSCPNGESLGRWFESGRSEFFLASLFNLHLFSLFAIVLCIIQVNGAANVAQYSYSLCADSHGPRMYVYGPSKLLHCDTLIKIYVQGWVYAGSWERRCFADVVLSRCSWLSRES